MSKENQRIEDHLNCVHWVIHNFIRVNENVCGLEYDDLYQEGCIALCRAAESFDEQRGAPFHSYAISVIHHHLLDYCRKIQSWTAPVVPLEAWNGEAAWDDNSGLYVEHARLIKSKGWRARDWSPKERKAYGL